MGRVDEAMRRAAEADVNGAPRVPESSEDAGSDSVAAGLQVDEFPVEAPERSWPRSVEPVEAPPAGVETKTPSRPSRTLSVTSLVERFGLNLSRKVVIDHDTEPASKEQYRRLATSLYAAQAAKGLKAVMVASAVANEGKSLTASNLALTFSESYQKRVLLIDGDLRRPSLHTVFGVEGEPGLTEGLFAADGQTLALHHITSTLTLLTAGQPTSDPMAALASDRMRLLVDEARETFDWILIDTPPIGLMADANLLSGIVDGALLVVRAESTPYDEVQRAVAMLGKERVLGVVLNRARPDASTKDTYYSYYQATRPAAPARD